MTSPAARPPVQAKFPAAWVCNPSLVAAWAGERGVAVPERTGDLPVTTVVKAIRAARLDDRNAAVAVAAAGVCPADLAAVTVHLGLGHRDLVDAGRFCAVALDEVARVYPDLGARDAFGWVLACAPHVLREVSWGSGTPSPWMQVGLLRGGWLYAAAGLSPVEARERVEAGTVVEDDMRVLAALRGVALPV